MAEPPVTAAEAASPGDAAALEQWACAAFEAQPLTNLIALVGLGAALFYQAEVGKNPKVTSYHDALIYISTCCSVGYGDIFAQTPLGKLIGTFVMTIGPAMANAAFDGCAAARVAEDEGQRALQRETLDVLKAILAELRAHNSGDPAVP